MVKVVSFNGVEIPSFVRVTGITFPTLAEVSMRESELPRRYGNLDNGVKFGGKPFSLKTVWIPENGKDIHTMSDELKAWLRGNDWKPSKFTFADQSNKYVNARVTNSVDVEDLFLYGEADINFYAADPVKYDVTETVNASSAGSAAITYKGLENAPTVVTATITADCTNLTLKHVQSGRELKLIGTFKAGQTVSFNSVQKLIKVNNTVAMDLLDFRSRWINLIGGSNTITLTTATAGVVNEFKVSHRKAD